jgi:isopentenyl-diphosphate delta-isomerase
MANRVVLVDATDRQVGTGDKLQVRRDGSLHRAFSVFVFNQRDELLLQRRALGKYHSGGLWSNTCCGHPGPAEPVLEAAHRRLQEEMRFDCQLSRAFHFIYRAEVGHGLIEHEYDHVLIGSFNGDPSPDLDEVDMWRWDSLPLLRQDVERNPTAYTAWFRMALGDCAWPSAAGWRPRRGRRPQ